MFRGLATLMVMLISISLLSGILLSSGASADDIPVATVSIENPTILLGDDVTLDLDSSPIRAYFNWDQMINARRDVLLGNYVGTYAGGMGVLDFPSRNSYCRFSPIPGRDDYLIVFRERTLVWKLGALDDCYYAFQDFGIRAETLDARVELQSDSSASSPSPSTLASDPSVPPLDLSNSLRLLSVPFKQGLPALIHVVTDVNTAQQWTRVANMPDSVGAVLHVTGLAGGPTRTLRPGQEITVGRRQFAPPPTQVTGSGTALSPAPALRVSTSALLFRSNAAQELTISNSGGGMLSWNAQANISSLVVTPSSGTLRAQEQQRVRVQLQMGALPGTDAAERGAELRVLSLRPTEEQQNPIINVTSNAGRQVVSVRYSSSSNTSDSGALP